MRRLADTTAEECGECQARTSDLESWAGRKAGHAGLFKKMPN